MFGVVPRLFVYLASQQCFFSSFFRFRNGIFGHTPRYDRTCYNPTHKPSRRFTRITLYSTVPCWGSGRCEKGQSRARRSRLPGGTSGPGTASACSGRLSPTTTGRAGTPASRWSCPTLTANGTTVRSPLPVKTSNPSALQFARTKHCFSCCNNVDVNVSRYLCKLIFQNVISQLCRIQLCVESRPNHRHNVIHTA